jgi:uncharacterized membrane protein
MFTKVLVFISRLDRVILFILALVLVVCTFLSIIIPPSQSPDEFAHIQRAYVLTKGTIVLDTPPDGRSSGGMVDSNLIAYMRLYRTLLPGVNPHRKISRKEIESVKDIKWSGVKNFSQIPGASYYFPVIYLPQAVGLWMGEYLGLSIGISYRLARLFALGSVIVLLLAAFTIYPANPLLIALLSLPMSLFQLSAAGLDGVSTALFIFSIAIFLRISVDKDKSESWLFYALTVSAFLLSTSRLHALPLFALVFCACCYTKKHRYFFAFSFGLLATFIWLIVTMKLTVDLRSGRDISTLNVIIFYFKNPLGFVDVLFETVSNVSVLGKYRVDFLGVLGGWPDGRFSSYIYSCFAVLLSLVGLFSISFKNIKNDWIPRALLFSGALASVLIIFFALLVAWTPHPAKIIQGIQGRYFFIPAIMITYALSGNVRLSDGVARKTSFAFLIALSILTTTATTKLLIERYYLMPEQPSEACGSVAKPPVPARGPDSLP